MMSSQSVTHISKSGTIAWLKFGFSNTYHVSRSRIWKRVGCCSNSLNCVIARVDDQKNIRALWDTKKGNAIAR